MPETGAHAQAGWPPSVAAGARDLFEQHYDDLAQIARRVRRRRSRSDTFLTSDLLHEAYVKLHLCGAWQSEAHFFGSATLAMRHVIVDRVKAKLALKRGGGAGAVSSETISLAQDDTHRMELALDIARSLDQLGAQAPRLVQVVDCRFFAGLTEAETARLLGVSERTVRRDWNEARDILEAQLKVSHVD